MNIVTEEVLKYLKKKQIIIFIGFFLHSLQLSSAEEFNKVIIEVNVKSPLFRSSSDRHHLKFDQQIFLH